LFIFFFFFLASGLANVNVTSHSFFPSIRSPRRFEDSSRAFWRLQPFLAWCICVVSYSMARKKKTVRASSGFIRGGRSVYRENRMVLAGVAFRATMVGERGIARHEGCIKHVY